MMQMLIIGWLYLSSQMFRTLEVVNVQVGVWGGQLQVVSLLKPSQDYRHHSLMTDRESRVFFDSLATLEYAFHHSFSVMYSEQGAFSNAR